MPTKRRLALPLAAALLGAACVYASARQGPEVAPPRPAQDAGETQSTVKIFTEEYDTRHTVFRPARMTAGALEKGYWKAYKQFYRWRSIMRGAATKPDLFGAARHVAYAEGWKKFEPLWDTVIRARRISNMLPVLESVLTGVGKHTRPSGFTGDADFIKTIN
jgi:hypothetical protein